MLWGSSNFLFFWENLIKSYVDLSLPLYHCHFENVSDVCIPIKLYQFNELLSIPDWVNIFHNFWYKYCFIHFCIMALFSNTILHSNYLLASSKSNILWIILSHLILDNVFWKNHLFRTKTVMRLNILFFNIYII